LAFAKIAKAGDAMDIVGRVKGILLTPETEWATIEHEPGTPSYLFPRYVVYLAAIPPLAGFIGSSIIGVAGPGGTYRVPLFAGLLGAVIAYVLSFAVVYTVAIIIDQLAPQFKGQKDFASALKVTVYAFTPYWVLGLFQLIAGLRFVGYVGALFGIYLLWLGLPRMMKPSPDKAVAYVATTAACAIIALAIITLIEAAFLT
jgi:hypothetical protein